MAVKEATLPNPFGAPENYWAPQDEKPAGFYGAAWPPGTFAAPSRYGQSLLSREGSDPLTKMYLDKIRSHGVTDKDVLWFWDMESVERIMRMSLFSEIVMAGYLEAIKKTGSPQQAALIVRKCQPCFGNPDDFAGSPNAPLPVELKERTEIYSRKRRLNEGSGFLRDMESSSTYNALLRRDIRAGRI